MAKLAPNSFGPLWSIFTGNQWEISEVGRLICFIEFLYDFILFVIDIHQIMLNSLFPTPFDHFHFHGSAGLVPKLILTPCLNTSTLGDVKPPIFHKIFTFMDIGLNLRGLWQ